MILRVTDLKLLLEYMTKEQSQAVDVTQNEGAFGSYTSFEFQDAENRECAIKIFPAASATTPELVKTMKLYIKDKK